MVPFLTEKYKTAGKMLMLFGTLIVGRMTAVEVLERVRGREKAAYIKEEGDALVSLYLIILKLRTEN